MKQINKNEEKTNSDSIWKGQLKHEFHPTLLRALIVVILAPTTPKNMQHYGGKTKIF